MGLRFLELCPEFGFDPLPEELPEEPLEEPPEEPLEEPLEELELLLDGLGVVLDGPVLVVDEPEPPLPMYGQGLQWLYEKPQVCPRRHVQARPTDGSRGQFWIPVQVLPEPEPEPDPEPEPYFTHNCQK